MKHSESLASLAPAMAKAQAALESAKKQKANPAFKGAKYADLLSVWEACEEALKANGLSVLQGFSTEGPKGSLWTMLLHTSGEYIMGTCPLVLPKDDPQGMGSATTYYRRYGLAAMLGITQEDDDGNAGSGVKDREIPKAAHKADDKELLDHLANIDAAATLYELQTAWNKIPQRLQFACTKAKDAKKAKLTEGSN